jgi:F-type H+-transporting ATPase subunit gamma
LVRGFFESPAQGPCGLVIIAADKGLCGAFNASLMRAAAEWLRARQGRKVHLALVGRKARDFVRRLQGLDSEVAIELVGIFPRVGFRHAEMLGQAVLDAYAKKGLSQWDVIYNEFKSVAQQRLVRRVLLPLADFEGGASPEGAVTDFRYEPHYAQLLEALLPRFLKAQLYRMLLESQAAELSARMNAMDAASKNAAELRETLNVQANRQRQAMITKEIAELVGGAEALAA